MQAEAGPTWAGWSTADSKRAYACIWLWERLGQAEARLLTQRLLCSTSGGLLGGLLPEEASCPRPHSLCVLSKRTWRHNCSLHAGVDAWRRHEFERRVDALHARRNRRASSGTVTRLLVYRIQQETWLQLKLHPRCMHTRI